MSNNHGRGRGGGGSGGSRRHGGGGNGGWQQQHAQYPGYYNAPDGYQQQLYDPYWDYQQPVQPHDRYNPGIAAAATGTGGDPNWFYNQQQQQANGHNWYHNQQQQLQNQQANGHNNWYPTQQQQFYQYYPDSAAYNGAPPPTQPVVGVRGGRTRNAPGAISDQQQRVASRQAAAVATQPATSVTTAGTNAKSQKAAKKDAATSGNVKTAASTAESQREVLIEELTSEHYECMVCCDRVLVKQSVWSCTECYHVFHLKCIQKWAKSPTALLDDGTAAAAQSAASSATSQSHRGWRCPGCQAVTKKVPHSYMCFCGKMREPDSHYRQTPHSCGEVCQRKRGGATACPHACNILCHPGPCPPCSAYVTRKCLCGKKSTVVRCDSDGSSLRCTATCEVVLNCSIHFCQQVCHKPPCQPCQVTNKQGCYCGCNEREVRCGSDLVQRPDDTDLNGVLREKYTCGDTCNRLLSCGEHRCERRCHSGECGECPLSPRVVTHCACGHTPLTDLASQCEPRAACTDPVPTCTGMCGKSLACGGGGTGSSVGHTCTSTCHTGPCPPCPLTTKVSCRCANIQEDVPCTKLNEEGWSDGVRCKKRCNKKKSCGRHKCQVECCVLSEHPCDNICGKKLSCGEHSCDEPCHRGNCPTCWRVSFEELYCECGSSATYPPVPCGTRRPECNKTCARQHQCQHKVMHSCHSEPSCPPCTTLMDKLCNGGHCYRGNIPCYLTNVSCGHKCDKRLPCGHACPLVCHQVTCRGLMMCGNNILGYK